jgi:S-adenosylmethionine hydrolase
MTIIGLITDFGHTDNYVGVMKGVIASINSNVSVIDINHNIEPGNIHQAAFQLFTSYKYFPENTIFMIIVDPGVGSNRKAIMIKKEHYFFIGPDNGVFTYILDNEESTQQIINITNEFFFLKNCSNTFHGRDIFSPVAAELSKDFDYMKFGDTLNENPVKLEIKKINITEKYIEGYILYSDRFGNIITNISSELLLSYKIKKVKIGNKTISTISKTFSEVMAGKLLSIIGSSSLLEIAVNQGNAKELIFGKTENIINVPVYCYY